MNKRLFAICITCCLVLTTVCLFLTLRNSSSYKDHRLQWWLSEINWDSAVRRYTGKNIRVAILDSAIDTNHSDLQTSIKVIRTSEEKIGSSLEHGTGIAGIICGNPAETNGMLGIAPEAEIISFPITDNENNVDIQQLISAIYKATEMDVDIINISCGISNFLSELEEAINKAFSSGIVIIASAGNFMENKLLYPAAFENVLAVGSKDREGHKISPIGNIEKSIVYLPGTNIVTIAPNNSYSTMFGTSPATAILTGIIAVVLEANPKIENKTIYKYFNKETLENVDVLRILKELGG